MIIVMQPEAGDAEIAAVEAQDSRRTGSTCTCRAAPSGR